MAKAHPDFDFDYTIEGLCQRVTVFLNDADPYEPNCRWSKSFLRSQIQDALYMAARLAPEHFTNTEKWKMEAGLCAQDVPPECGKLIEVLCITDCETGEEVTQSEVNADEIKRMTLYPSRCGGKCAGAVGQFSLNLTGTSETGFTVYPAPPESDRYEVSARCVNITAWMNDEGALCEEIPVSLRHLVPAFVQLITGMVLMMSRDDATLIAQAQLHMSSFNTLLGLTLNFDQVFAGAEAA